MGWVLSCETGRIPRCRCRAAGQKTTSSHALIGECEMDLAQSETPCTWRRPLYGTWEISLVPRLRFGPVQEGKSRTLNMHASEKSDRAILPEKRPNNGRRLPAEVVEGRARLKGNNRQAAAARTQSWAVASIRVADVRRVMSASKPFIV